MYKFAKAAFRPGWLFAKELIRCLYIIYLICLPNRGRGRRRVLFFGPPIISIKYITQAIKPIVESSRSLVTHVYAIHTADDFDVVSLKPLAMCQELRDHQIYLIFYDSLDYFLGPISKHLFAFYKTVKGKKIVVMPYGSDTFLYSKLTNISLRHALNVDYPMLAFTEKTTERRYQFVSRLADCRLTCIGHTYNLSTWDMLPVVYYPFQVDPKLLSEKKADIFTLIHSPNHRGVKGTEFIIEAVRNLQERGVSIVLKLLEGVPNSQVLVELARAHVLVDQVIFGYALSAMEGMALGLPVISNYKLPEHKIFSTYSYLDECPIVSAGPCVKEIEEAILYIIANYDELSKRARAYMEKYHSYPAAQVMWNKIFEFLEGGERPMQYFHPLVGEYDRDYQEWTCASKLNVEQEIPIGASSV